jgi:PA14 domain
MMFLYDWIPQQPPAIVARALELATPGAPGFALACLPLFILCILSLSARWARFTDRPIIFALTHSIPFFLFTFQDSLGDAGQVLDGVRARYHMSEPLATWSHYWSFRFLHEPFNIGAKDAVGLTSRIAGFFYLFFVAKVSLKLYPDLSPTRRLLHRLVFLTAAISFLFYGYIENPPLALPAEQLWVLLSLTFLQVPTMGNLAKCSAALALTALLHGRASFLYPALAFGCLIPAGTLLKRLSRAVVGSLVFFGCIAAFVTYVFVIEPNHISGGHLGNVTGGGNRQMFVTMSQMFSAEHWQPIVRSLLIFGGLIAPLGLLRLFTMWRKPDAVSVWCLGYLAADVVYLFLWEFDYGPYIDWDLVASGVCPLLLMGSMLVVRSRIPAILILPLLLASSYISNTWAVLTNGAPLGLYLTPTAEAPSSTVSCTVKGLKRTYFKDANLSIPAGPAETDVPYHEFGPSTIAQVAPGATNGLGGVFDGFVSIPKEGRYRFFVLGQGNFRFTVGGHTLVNRWVGHEWRVSADREIRFPSAGRYPIRLEFFTINQNFPVMLDVESADYERRKVTAEDLCLE